MRYFNEDTYQFKSYKIFNEIIRLTIGSKSFKICYSQNYLKEQYKGIGIIKNNGTSLLFIASKLVKLLNISNKRSI